ncbi:MAG TPA: DUF4864 domain-containing protein [Casimicrobiaceae bacterium]|nr:DUF4864 domain-containing protein [Casimicrobiaceae bacterium]
MIVRLCNLAILTLALFVADAHASSSPTAGDWIEIKRVIAAQREALMADDGERAFSFAAPSIRRHFGDASTFMRMVRQGYEPLTTARYVEFLDGAVIAGDVVQPLRLVMPDGVVMVAIYGTQQQPDGSWRITSCVIAPSTLRSASAGRCADCGVWQT